LKKLLPELHNLYPGDELNLRNYPYLKQIIQVGHHTIRGVVKFKDAMVYANPKLSAVELPVNKSDDEAYVSYRGGKLVSSFTSGDLVERAQSLWRDHLSQSDRSLPLFISVNLESPFAVSAFLGANANL
jgi:hypothetical protein